MNITFLIGNGFDLNLGLKTAYSDFVEYYRKTKPDNIHLKALRDDISKKQELWSFAEAELGKYTSRFETGEAAAFSECQTDFCEHLANYLKEQELRIDCKHSKEAILKAFSRLNQITETFPTQERLQLMDVFQRRKTENIIFNFICFNYTTTLDQCLSIVKDTPDALGTHKHGEHVFKHKVGEICHVHGTVNKDMVFGVNDDSQIANLDIFDCENGDLYKNLLIKIQANATYLENTDVKASELLKNSHLIYIYGMSIGETDKIWWERVCTWLCASQDRHLIVQKYGFPTKSVLPMRYQIAERTAKREIIGFSGRENLKTQDIEKRIHITSENIFEDIESMAFLSTYNLLIDVIDEKIEKNKSKELVHS